MKTLILIRHAKSSWSDPSLMDFDRPLNERGKRDSPIMAAILKRKFPKIDLFLSSTAKRAFVTAKVVAQAFDMSEDEIVPRKDLYHASPQSIYRIISEQSDNLSSIAVFAHNPGLTDLANRLTNVRLDNLPTTGIFAVQFNVNSWNDLQNASGEFVFFEYPKKYKNLKTS